MGEGLALYLPQITTLMLLSLRSTEGIVPQYDGSSSFLLFDDESDGEEEEELMDEDEEEEDDSEISGYSVENAFFDEKEDTCTALGEIAVHTSVAFLPYMESVFEEVFRLLECPHLSVRKAAHEALGQFCCALHKACQSCPSEPNTAANHVPSSAGCPGPGGAILHAGSVQGTGAPGGDGRARGPDGCAAQLRGLHSAAPREPR